jgi:hypothetical protein
MILTQLLEAIALDYLFDRRAWALR